MRPLATIPLDPGVYLFKDSKEEVIYVGKAKSLRKRVASYFSSVKKAPKTEVLVANIVDIDIIATKNEVEALILENRLVKKHKPRYNIALKDGKTYAYIKLTDDPYPRILSTRQRTKRGTYFGPYTDGLARRELIKLAVELFKLRTCKHLPKRPCLQYHIGLCTAPCAHKVTKDEYLEQVIQAKRFLAGETRDIRRRLEREMREAAEREQFEIALQKRRQLEALEHNREKQFVDRDTQRDEAVVAMQELAGKAHIVLFTIKRGVLSGKLEFTFEHDEDIFASFLKLYYSTRKVPREIIVSHAFWEDEREREAIEEYLAQFRGGPVTLTHPQRGEKVRLIEMALRNLEVKDTALDELRDRLNLPQAPRSIECFDVSHLGGTQIVAGMVRFTDRKPSDFRKFLLRTVEQSDDFASMREVVHRRFSRLLEEKEALPDLVVIDGGAGQVSAAMGALEELGVRVPLIGLAKREEEIYLPGKEAPLRFPQNDPMMLLLRGLRDRTHRLAIAYNRKRRQMSLRDA